MTEVSPTAVGIILFLLGFMSVALLALTYTLHVVGKELPRGVFGTLKEVHQAYWFMRCAIAGRNTTKVVPMNVTVPVYPTEEQPGLEETEKAQTASEPEKMTRLNLPLAHPNDDSSSSDSRREQSIKRMEVTSEHGSSRIETFTKGSPMSSRSERPFILDSNEKKKPKERRFSISVTNTWGKIPGAKVKKHDERQSLVKDFEAYEWEINPKKLQFKHAIGRGNFGEVWLATWIGSPVAVKTLLPKLFAKQNLVDRFIDEIKMMSTLHHPNVTMFLGACVRRTPMCLVLEYCAHGSLHSFLRNEHKHKVRISLSLIYRFALDIARGVYYLHKKQNIVQRDLKARNMLVDGSLNAKVADFGMSRALEGSDEQKLTACGTPAWIAPEIVKMEKYSTKVDVYSFAIVLWELITRQEPFGGRNGVQIAYAAAQQGLRPEIPDSCPSEYAELMQQCWASDPNDRPGFGHILKTLFQLKKQADGSAKLLINRNRDKQVDSTAPHSQEKSREFPPLPSRDYGIEGSGHPSHQLNIQINANVHKHFSPLDGLPIDLTVTSPEAGIVEDVQTAVNMGVADVMLSARSSSAWDGTVESDDERM